MCCPNCPRNRHSLPVTERALCLVVCFFLCPWQRLIYFASEEKLSCARKCSPCCVPAPSSLWCYFSPKCKPVRSKFTHTARARMVLGCEIKAWMWLSGIIMNGTSVYEHEHCHLCMACRADGASVEPCGWQWTAEFLPVTPAGEFLPLTPALDRGGVNAMRVLTAYIAQSRPPISRACHLQHAHITHFLCSSHGLRLNRILQDTPLQN